jgi:hypothetical protein
VESCRPPDGLAGQDELRRPPAATSTSAAAPWNPSPHSPPSPCSPAPPPNLTLTRRTGRPPLIPAPARLPGRRRPRPHARGELPLLPSPSLSPLPLCIAAATQTRPRPPLDLAVGRAPAANSRRHHHQMVPRVALSLFPLTRALNRARIARFELSPSSQRAMAPLTSA